MDGQSEPAHEHEALSLRQLRRRHARVMAACLAVLVALGAAALAGLVPGVPLRSGPLEDLGTTGIWAPVHPGDTGVLWGVLDLENRTGSEVTLDSIELTQNPDRMELLAGPYLWDETRFEALGVGGISAYPLPLPRRWSAHPPGKHPVQGYRIRSGSDAKEYDGGSAEVVFEFAVPEKTSTVRGITVRYHVGWLAYEKTYDMSLTVCPLDVPCT